MLKNLLTLYFSFYLALSPIFAQANSVSQIANQFNHKAPTQNITINSDGTIINSSNITSKQNTNTNDNRASHYGEDNNIYLIDDNINNTKDLTTTIGHETSHALDSQDPSINTNPQNNASKADNETYAQNYGDDFKDYVEFASENYGNGNLASTNNRNLGNTPAETQKNTKLVERNNQDYARIDKSKGEDFCTGTDCYGKATQKRLEKSTTNPNVVVTITNKKNTSSDYSNYQVREMQDKNGKVIAYSAYNPNTGKNIVMKPEELATFKGLVENNLMYSFENATNYQNTASNAIGGLHDGEIGGTGDSWKQYAKSGDIVLDLAGGLGDGVGGVGASKVVGRVDKFTQLKKTNASIYKKLDTYLLNANHIDGKSKAKFFKEVLGYDRNNINKLAKQIKFNQKTATKKSTNQYGTKYQQIIRIEGANGRLVDVKFVWIRNKDGVARLVTGVPSK